MISPVQASPASTDADGSTWQTIPFDRLSGWDEADHASAFDGFRATCHQLQDNPPHMRRNGMAVADLMAACAAAHAGPSSPKAFFETHFTPKTLIRDGHEAKGFLTGYYEPEVAASRTRTDRFSVPLYKRPADLVSVKNRKLPAGWDTDVLFARDTPDGLEPYPDRAAIEAGFLDGRGLELAFVETWIDAFFIHVQGSARLRFDDGSVMRIAYAGKSGHAYSSIGKLLAEAEDIDPASITMPVLRQWLADNPQEGLRLMRRNRSFIFFRALTDLGPQDGPVGAAGTPLRALASLAVDRTWHLFGTPVWVDSPGDATPAEADPASKKKDGWRGFSGLTIAQDTGSAIRGPVRADLFVGSGSDAGAEAGIVRHPARLVFLWPRTVSERRP